LGHPAAAAPADVKDTARIALKLASDVFRHAYCWRTRLLWLDTLESGVAEDNLQFEEDMKRQLPMVDASTCRRARLAVARASLRGRRQQWRSTGKLSRVS
jgi:hypothetical protein